MENKNFKVIALALHFSILIYVLVIFILAKNSLANEWVMTFRILPDQKILVFVLVAFALINTGVSVFVKPLIPRMALAESVAIFGFMTAFLNHSFLLVVPFAAWALILQIAVGPWFQSQGLASPPPSA